MDLRSIVTGISVLVCTIIVVNGILYYKKTKTLSNYFEGLLKDFNEGISSNPARFSKENLEKIRIEFENSLENVENINTQVIIEKYLYDDDKLKRTENGLDYLPNLATVLGLLGTFLGLTFAIYSMGFTFNFNNMDDFLNQLSPVLGSMGGAFITSIFGLIASIFMNLSGGEYTILKQDFIDQMEDYLDNKQAKKKDADSKLLLELIGSMTKAIDCMSENIKQSTSKTEELSNGMSILNKELSDINGKIAYNNENLIKVTNGLKTSLNEFNKPISEFNKGIESFRGIYTGLDSKMSNFDNLINKDFKGVVSEFVDCLNQNNNSQEDLIKGQREITENLLQKFDKNICTLENIYGNLNKHLDSINSGYIEQRNTWSQNSLDLKNTIENLNRETSTIGDRISNKVLQSIGRSVDMANQDLLKNMNETNQSILKNMDIVKQGILKDMDKLSEQLPNELQNITTEFTKTQSIQQEQNKEVLETMKDTIKSIYKQVEDVQRINLKK